jgi:hypothetical protein
MTRPQFVWCDTTGTGRNVFVLFRRSFTIAGDPAETVRKAELHLFADTRYRLWVNGQVVAYGPARFLPTHPEYDTVDLQPWLRKGKNALVVEANAFGESAFESAPSVGGFVAWGKVLTGRTPVDLTTPGGWKMQRAEAWDADAPLYSFAQAPVEIVDLRALPEGVHEPQFNDRAWAAPVVIERQDAWGELRPRSIPMLGMDLYAPEKVLVHSALARNEEVVGGRVTAPRPEVPGTTIRCCYATHIHSPVEQEVTLGLFWGPHFLNGEPMRSVKNTALGNREDFPVRLRAGWNFLYGEPAMLAGVWAQKRVLGILLGLPGGKGLVASAEPDLGCPDTMILSDGVAEEVLRAAREASCGNTVTSGAASAKAGGAPAPTCLEQLPRLDVPWHRARRGELVPCPARVMAWDTPESRSVPATAGTHAVAVAQPNTVTDLRIPARQDWVTLFDFGAEFLGHVVLDVEAPAGTVLDVAYEEHLREDGLAGLYRCNRSIDNADRFVVRGGHERIEGFRSRGGRYVQVAVRCATEPVALHSLRIRKTLCPVEITGRFECSDPVLNWAWSAGVHTLLTTLEDAWVDVWRERGLYLGDAYVFCNATATFWSDPAMVRRCLRLWAHGQYPDGQIRDVVPAWHNRPLIDYTLIWVMLLHDHVQRTADLELLREVWPNVERVFASSVWEEGPNGLWSGDREKVFIDWTTTPEMCTGENGVLNAFRYGALRQAAEMATLLGETKTAALYTSEARRAKRAFQALWDESAGHYAAALHDGKPFQGYSAHANVLALLYGLAEGKRARAAMEYVRECLSDENFMSPTHLELYFHKYVLDMLYDRGEVALAEHVMRRSWGLMKNAGAWAMWETLYRGIEKRDDLCIGWSTAPMISLARRILGVRPVPGHPREVLVAPMAETLTFARGAVAHPDGPIEVEWRVCGAGKARRLEVTVSAPKALRVRVAPEGALAELPLKTSVRQR